MSDDLSAVIDYVVVKTGLPRPGVTRILLVFVRTIEETSSSNEIVDEDAEAESIAKETGDPKASVVAVQDAYFDYLGVEHGLGFRDSLN